MRKIKWQMKESCSPLLFQRLRRIPYLLLTHVLSLWCLLKWSCSTPSSPWAGSHSLISSVPSSPPQGHGQWLRGRASEALLRQPLYEWPHLLQLLETAAEGAEASTHLPLRGMRQRGRRVLLPDGGDPAQCGGGLHGSGAACTRRSDSRNRLLLIRVTKDGLCQASTYSRWREQESPLPVCNYPSVLTPNSCDLQRSHLGKKNDLLFAQYCNPVYLCPV